MPASAVGLLIGNLYYAWQAHRLARRENRADVCALPFGMSIILLVTFVFLVLYPAKVRALNAGLSEAEASMAAWRAGVGAAFIMGLIECAGAFAGGWIRRFTPRAALLSTLAGIALAFLALDFFFRAYAFPVVGLTTLGLSFLFYFGGSAAAADAPRPHPPPGRHRPRLGVPFHLRLDDRPGGQARFRHARILPADPESLAPHHLVALDRRQPAGRPAPRACQHPLVAPDDRVRRGGRGQLQHQNCLLFNGFATMGSALFGSPFLATIYFGHPGWKAIGSRAGYSVLNAAAMTAIACTGTLGIIVHFIPVEAGMALIIWIGLAMTAQAFEVVPPKHIPAVVVGPRSRPRRLHRVRDQAHPPRRGLRDAGSPDPRGRSTRSSPDRADYYSAGVFAIGEGYIYTCMILSAATVHIIDRRFMVAAAWFASGGVIAILGLAHNYRITGSDIIGVIGFAPGAIPMAYGIMAGMCLLTDSLVKKTVEPPLAGH
jgi:adenine/guanine/hypoxanthine permease